MLRNFSYVIDHELAGCAHPDSYGACDEALEELKELGIGAVVSLDEVGIPLYLMADLDLHHLHLPIPDFGVPTMEQADEFVDFVRHEKAAGRQVAVHCGAGYGRTGTMLACYLVAEGASAEEAVTSIRRKRPGSIETPEQERFVDGFAKHLGTKKASRPPRKKKG